MLRRYNNAAGTLLVSTTNYNYDGFGRLSSMAHNSGSLIGAYTMHYDRAQRLDASSLARPTLSESVTYSYDTAGQLTAANSSAFGLETFSYDVRGNRQAASGVQYQNTTNNRISTDGTFNYYYDNEGNVTLRIRLINGVPSGGTREFYWDQHNRLTTVIDRANPGGAPLVTYTFRYDVFDRRVFESHVRGPHESWYYFYDGDDVVLAGHFGSGGGGSGGGGLRRYLHGPAVDEILAQDQVNFGGTDWAYPDHLGSIRNVQGFNGNQTFDFTAFGQLRGGQGWFYGFTGREYDHNTGLNYHRNRWLDPAIARWLSEDPISYNAGDANLNRYVGITVTTHVDPNGLRKPGHHIVPWSIFNGKVSADVQNFFDSDAARICNEFYDFHNGKVLDDISHHKYTKSVKAELDRFLDKRPLREMTLRQAESFLKRLRSLPNDHMISKFNKAVAAEAANALRQGMQMLRKTRRAQIAAARRGVTSNPLLGALTGGTLTTASAIYEAVNTPYDENTNCFIGPHFDAGVESLMPFNLRPEVEQIMTDHRRRLSRRPVLELRVTVDPRLDDSDEISTPEIIIGN